MAGPNTYDLLNKILERQEEIRSDVTDIKVEQARQHETLQEHMRRSAANEEAVDILRQEIKPIQSHIYGVNAIAKSIAFIAVVAGLFVSILKIIQFFE